MIISKKWLSDYVTVDMAPRAFSTLMASTGFEIDEMEHTGEGLKDIVMGRLTKIERHPTVDKYRVCQVDVGGGRVLQLVTAATNLIEGGMCPVVLPGGQLKNGVVIESAVFEGVKSEGMMCSLPELGLTKNDFPHAIEEGIFFLDEDCQPGQDALPILGLDDTLYDFSITANRPDGHSVHGVAREVCAALDQPYHQHLPVVKGGAGPIEDLLEVEILAPDLCPRYTARAVTNVKIGPSPKWLRERIRAGGMRPINNVVDITNYVMMEYGQPMHAFDIRELIGKGGKAKIIVRQAGEDKTFVTLDHQERTLSPEVLMICNAHEPVGIAGIMGGLQSGIKEDTATIVFESANFHGPSLRGSGRKLGMRTDAQARYEKGLDAQMTVEAVNRACELCELLGCADTLDGMIDIDNSGYQEKIIPLDVDRINFINHTALTREQMVAYLERLNFQVKGGVEGDLVHCPSYRADMEGIADLAEEVVRLYGLDNVPSVLHKSETAQGRYTEEQQFERRAVAALTGFGYYEAITYSFYSPKVYDQIRLPQDHPLRNAVVIKNPLGEDTSIMRTTMLPSMLQTLATNYSHRNESARLFELGRIYLPTPGENDLPEERIVLTLGTYGAGDFYTLKGVVEGLCNALCVQPPVFSTLQDHPTFHPGRCAAISMGGVQLGVMGELHPRVREGCGIDVPALVATLDMADLLAHKLQPPAYTPVPRTPAATRDLALVCDEVLEVARLEQVLQEVCGDLLEQLTLFDVYRGPTLGEGKKSVAYALTLRDRETTLTDTRVAALLDEALGLLKEKYGVEIRGQ